MLQGVASRLAAKRKAQDYTPLRDLEDEAEYSSDDIRKLVQQQVQQELASRSARRYIHRDTFRNVIIVMLILVMLGFPFVAMSTKSEIAPRFPNMTEPYRSVAARNDAVFARLEQCRDLQILESDKGSALARVEADRKAADGCGTNQTSVVILAEDYFSAAYGGSRRGEDVWAFSTLVALKSYSYAYLFTSQGQWNYGMDKTLDLYRPIRNNVKLVLASPEQVDWCYKHEGCLKSDQNPDGIEPWKLLTHWYWDDPRHPLGYRFTLSPSTLNTQNRNLPYSVEYTCYNHTFIPIDDRPRQGYLLAKQIKYFRPKDFAWSFDALGRIAEAETMQWVAGIRGNPEMVDLYEAVNQTGIINHGKMEQEGFFEELGRSRVMLGIGMPKISPSPWDALCMGVPFINPILQWDIDDPLNRSAWVLQQWRMADLEPPFVYHVHAHDYGGLAEAIQLALANPIGRYVPPSKMFEKVRHTVAELVEWDWRNEYELALAERNDTT